MREIEARFSDELIVIGVHSAKYTTEKDDRHLAAAIRRNDIGHPVVNDGDMSIWQQYGVRAWPTLMFLDPAGKVFGKHEGEFLLDAMIPVIEQMLAEYDAEGLIERSPIDAIAHPDPLDSTLAFPAGIDVLDDKLFVADTNHNRIVIAGLDGQIRDVIGRGETGMDDGPGSQATFNRPHGLAATRETLYVADTGNHAIRKVNLESGVVTTLVGTGEQAYRYMSGGPALETALNSPWDVTILDGTLYIAMAGNHQLWSYRIGSDEAWRFAGTGHEGIRDGTLANSWLAQSSGIAALGDDLIFSDAETSSIRRAAISGDTITTLIGRDLFDWGDTDGHLDMAQIQHATGVTVDARNGHIFIADTYNNKIKRIDLASNTIDTLAGSGQPGHVDGNAPTAQFFEPHALGISGNHLFVADTNNHAIRQVDLGTGAVTTLEVTGG